MAYPNKGKKWLKIGAIVVGIILAVKMLPALLKKLKPATTAG